MFERKTEMEVARRKCTDGRRWQSTAVKSRSGGRTAAQELRKRRRHIPNHPATTSPLKVRKMLPLRILNEDTLRYFLALP